MPDKKSTDPLDWEDLRYFMALARHGSLSATARALKVTHGTVARRLAVLESALQSELFDRRDGRYSLTKDGALILDAAKPMEAAALAMQDRLAAGTDLHGIVRLTTVRPLADDFLVPRLGDFARRYPDLDLEIITEARVMSLALHEADIALRLGRPKDGTLLARRVGRIAYAYYAAAGGLPDIEADTAPALIGYDEDSDDYVPEAQWMRRRFPHLRTIFRSNSYSTQAAAARAGLGLAILPCYLADQDRALVRVNFADTPPDREIWLLTRKDLAKVPRIRVMIDYLADMFQHEHAMLAGLHR